jgi:serine O-acetyltransferase
MYKNSPKVLRVPVRAVHLLTIKLSEIFLGISIGSNVKLGERFIIEHFSGIIIHSEVSIGNDVRIRQGVTIGNKSARNPLAVPIIGDRVDIGAGAKILGDIFVGDDSVIGANAVVIRDVPPGATAVGVPATYRLSRKSPDLSREIGS